MKLISAKDIFGREYFETYSEFHLALSMAKVFHLYGYTFDMSMMEIDKSILPKSAFSLFKNLVLDGIIYVEGIDTRTWSREDSIADIDISYFNDIEIYNKTPEEAIWSFEYAQSEYGSKYHGFSIFKQLAYSVMAVVSLYIVRKVLGMEDAPKLKVKIGLEKSRNTFIYSSIYSCQKSLDWFNNLVVLEVNYSGKAEVDLDYEVFCNNSYISHKHKYYNVSEKRGFLEKLGFVPGSILIYWERVGMCENNMFGRIKSATVIRVDEVGDDFIGFTSIALNKTKEEVLQEYYDIDESIRYLFSDIPSKTPVLMANTRHLSNIGVDSYFYDESYLITKIDKREKVAKLVTIDGEVRKVEMSGDDAIYWLLCQYDIEFDRDLFRDMYGVEGQPLLWDMYNG